MPLPITFESLESRGKKITFKTYSELCEAAPYSTEDLKLGVLHVCKEDAQTIVKFFESADNVVAFAESMHFQEKHKANSVDECFVTVAKKGGVALAWLFKDHKTFMELVEVNPAAAVLIAQHGKICIGELFQDKGTFDEMVRGNAKTLEVARSVAKHGGESIAKLYEIEELGVLANEDLSVAIALAGHRFSEIVQKYNTLQTLVDSMKLLPQNNLITVILNLYFQLEESPFVGMLSDVQALFDFNWHFSRATPDLFKIKHIRDQLKHLYDSPEKFAALIKQDPLLAQIIVEHDKSLVDIFSSAAAFADFAKQHPQLSQQMILNNDARKTILLLFTQLDDSSHAKPGQEHAVKKSIDEKDADSLKKIYRILAGADSILSTMVPPEAVESPMSIKGVSFFQSSAAAATKNGYDDRDKLMLIKEIDTQLKSLGVSFNKDSNVVDVELHFQEIVVLEAAKRMLQGNTINFDKVKHENPRYAEGWNSTTKHLIDEVEKFLDAKNKKTGPSIRPGGEDI